MEIKELRIGNFVYDTKGNVNTVCVETFVKFNHQIEPIPLTEEWLVNFGAKEIDQELCFMVNAPDCWLCLFSSKGNFYPSLYLAPEFSNSEHNVIGLNSINSVHQLQNLYFTLTGNELILKP